MKNFLNKLNWRKVTIALLVVCIMSMGLNIWHVHRERAARQFFAENIIAHLGVIYAYLNGAIANIENGSDNPLQWGAAILVERAILSMDALLLAFAINHSPRVRIPSFWWTMWLQMQRIVEYSNTPAEDLRLIQSTIRELIIDLSVEINEEYFPALNAPQTAPDFSIRPRAFFERVNATLFELRNMPHGF